MLIARDIHKRYGTLHVLKGVTLEVRQGEVVSIVGSSGAGKSTLLHILGTLDKPDSGSVYIDGEGINFRDNRYLANFRNRLIGFVFQFHHLLPEFTAVENVIIPALIANKNEEQVRSKAEELLVDLGLMGRLEHKPQQLSGGEQQRVAVARALINQPAIVMADEPSGNLDSDNSRELHQLFFDLRKKYNQTFIIVTHNNQLADMADRKLVMKDGLIV